ncbi:amidohydrolase family protein [Christiangramia echinicola]|uniref:Imidazolonepropionase n=1 Tax=Christiangramia echinicola TaxID=279359 RepID=A0A1H1PNL5_9FLAO|nr:amidohydrolase family protein [Christiangramia echinicola]SDS12647.1 Imidazolonepropionase [Christiangramia echinicola]
MKKLFFLFLITLISCKSEPENVDLLITNATVLDIEQNKKWVNRFVAIRSDTIVAVKTMRDSDDFIASETYDAKGGFVMPGLWDNHVHFRGGDTLASENKNLLPLFLKYGITTVRDAGGDISEEVFKWKSEIENGELTGPRIFSSGPKLDGEDPAWPGSISVTSEDDVQKALDSLEKMNADYVKIYDGSISKEIYYEIIREAEKRNLKVTGHMPMTADVTEAVKFGLDGTEHLYYVMKAASAKKDSIEKAESGYAMIVPLAKTYNDSIAELVFDELGESEFYVTPTLHIGKVLENLADEDHSKDKLLQFIGPGIQETYQGRIMSAKRAKESGTSMRDHTEEVFKKMIKPMYNHGIRILAGSDCGPYNSFIYPGESLHKELKAIVDAGLNTQQALLTSIRNGPRFFGLQNSFVRVEKGRVADLIILSENPMENIENLGSINTVVTGSKTIKLSELAN